MYEKYNLDSFCIVKKYIFVYQIKTKNSLNKYYLEINTTCVEHFVN